MMMHTEVHISGLYNNELQTFVGPADVAADALHVCPMAFDVSCAGL